MRLLFFFLIFTASAYSQDIAEEEYPYFEFELGQTYYTLGDSVNLRSKPNVKGSTIAQLPIASEITILRGMEEMSKINNFLMRWYEVKTATGQRGYIWGGKIAQVSFRSAKDYAVTFHAGLSKINSEGQSWHEVRVVRNGKQQQRLLVQTWGLKITYIENQGNRGLKEIADVIVLSANGEFCGDSGGSKILIFANNQLTEALELTNYFDAPIFAYHTVYFPADMKGMPNEVLLEFVSGAYVEDVENAENPEPELQEHTLTTFTWNGQELVRLRHMEIRLPRHEFQQEIIRLSPQR